MTTKLIDANTRQRPSPVVQAWNAQWPVRFIAEADRLRRTLGTTGRGGAIDIQHIGSTAVTGLASTDTIDMLLITPDLATFDSRRNLLTGLGYRSLGDNGVSSQRKLELGPSQAVKVALYVYQPGNAHALHHLLVRDYLRSYPAERDSFSTLKIQLTQQSAHSKHNYSRGKRTRLTRLLELATGRR